MQKTFNNLVDIIQINKFDFHFYVDEIQKTFRFKLEEIDSDLPVELFSSELKNQVLFKHEIENNCGYITLYSLDNKVYLLKETVSNNASFIDNHIFDIEITNYLKEIQIKKLGSSTLQLFDEKNNSIIRIEDFLTETVVDITLDFEFETNVKSRRFEMVSKVAYDRYYLIVAFNNTTKKLSLNKVIFEKVIDSPKLNFEFINRDQLVVRNSYDNSKAIFSYKKVNNKKPVKIFNKKTLKGFKEDNLLGIYNINKEKYYIYLKLKGIFVIKKNPKKVSNFKSYLESFYFRNNLYIFGRMVHHAYNSFGKYEYLYTVDEKHLVSKFVRPFRRLKFLKQFGFFKISAKKLDIKDRVHYPLFIGSKDFVLHRFQLGRNEPASKVFSLKRFGNKVQVLRSDIYKQATYSIVPYSEMYSKNNNFKIKLSHFVSSYFYKNKKYNVNLFFEKQASKADESGFRVFEKVKETNGWNSKNYFILDKNAEAYPVMKKKYKDDIIDRFSFRHYLAIFNADYFMSSDLSNHVINDRIYINEINEKIKEVPLIFLQHGIMFAKPVENPLGKIFYKNYAAYNIYKNVVNSKLEANEFYKMGYNDSDLLYTGLATFDYAKLDENSDKIVFMPTYRYWEEGMIYSGNIENTTYFKSIISVIKAFDEAGIRDKLMVVSHNKFAEYIYDSMEEYRDVLGPNPSEALKVGRIFITDFSSAIYDATFRGAYPIFYWEEKDYLIEKYEAVPPVNEINAPGVIAINTNQLLKLVKNAIKNDYKREEEIIEKYKQINEFDDRKNTDRIVDYLKKTKII